MRRAHPRGDEGSVLVLVLGLAALLVVMVGVVVDVSAAVLARRSLASATDGAAVTAAQALDEQSFYARGPVGGVPLSPVGVADAVAAYEQRLQPDLPGVVLSGAVDGGYVAVVNARREVRLPLGGWAGPGTVTVTATARARAPLTQP